MQTNEHVIAVRLADKNGQTTLVVSRNDNNRLNLLQWPLKQLEPAGYHALCQELGDRVLRMLWVANQDAFEKHPGLTPPALDIESPYGLADALIQRSYKEKTTAYISTIERIIEHSADELSVSGLTETWPSVRANLMETFSP